MAEAPIEVEVLTDPQKLKRYTSRLEWAISDQDGWRHKANVFQNYYRNRPRIYTKGGQRVVVPTALKNVDAMHAALTAFEVHPVIAPKGLTTYDIARVQTEALKDEWEEQEVAAQTEYAIKDGLITGLGVVKVDYLFEEEPAIDEETGEEVFEEVEDEETGEVVEAPVMVTLTDTVVVEHIPWDEIFIDPDAKKWEDIRWVAQKYVLPLDQVKRDPRFDNTTKLKGDTVTSHAATIDQKEPEDDEDRIVLYDMYDLERGIKVTFSLSQQRILRESPIPFALRRRLELRNPFVPFIPRSNPNKAIGIGDIEAMKPAIDEQNVLRSSIATWVERNKPKLVTEEGVFTEKSKKALRSQEWGEVVEARATSMAQGIIQPLQVPTLPQEAFVQDGKAETDANEAIGLNELLQGQLPVGRKTATGMQMMAQSSVVRQSEKRNKLERFYRGIADRMLYIMKMFYEHDRITRIVDDIGDIVWDWNNEDIAFESLISVHVEPKEILDTQAKQEKFLAILNILGAMPNIDITELANYIMESLGIPAEVRRRLVKDEEQMAAEAEAAQASEAEADRGGAEGAQQTPFPEGVIPEREPVPGSPLPGRALVEQIE